jgi:glycosyltransferase involved in cell wall biosynthesis
MPESLLSIIVPTRNRCALLLKLLDSLAQMPAADHGLEVIVADDGSTDDSLSEIQKRCDPFALRVLRADCHRGPAAARNRGAREARGEILGFLDSDVVVNLLWKQAALAHFKNPEIVAVEGATLPPDGSPRPTPFTHYVANFRGGSYQTCNFLCRAKAFQAVGGFDERFCWQARGKLWHIREDTDLAFSLLELGGKIVFEAQAEARHPLVPASPWVYWRETRFGMREALLRRKHPCLYAQKLSWLDGRAFPVSYWGVYLGWAGLLVSYYINFPLGQALGSLGLAAGWVVSVYLVCRKRHWSGKDVLILFPQFFIIPWLRLYWVLRGEWEFRRVRSFGQGAKVSGDRQEGV